MKVRFCQSASSSAMKEVSQPIIRNKVKCKVRCQHRYLGMPVVTGTALQAAFDSPAMLPCPQYIDSNAIEFMAVVPMCSEKHGMLP